MLFTIGSRLEVNLHLHRRNGQFLSRGVLTPAAARPAMAPVVYTRRQEVPPGHKGVRVSKSHIDKAGNGLFAASVFEEGDIITEYDGEFVSDQRAKQLSVQTHLAAVNRHLKIAGLRRVVAGRGGGAFANDCRTDSRWTYNAERYAPAGTNRLYLRALHRIDKGEEIFWSYGSDRAFAIAMGWERHT